MSSGVDHEAASRQSPDVASIRASGEAAIAAARDVIAACGHARDAFDEFIVDIDCSLEFLAPLRNGVQEEAVWLSQCFDGNDAGVEIVNSDLIRFVAEFEQSFEILLREGVIEDDDA